MKTAYKFIHLIDRLIEMLDAPKAIRALQDVLLGLCLNMLDHEPEQDDRDAAADALRWLADEAVRAFETGAQPDLASDDIPVPALGRRPKTRQFFDATVRLRNQIDLRKHDPMSVYVLALNTLRVGLEDEPVDPEARDHFVELILSRCAKRMRELAGQTAGAAKAPHAPDPVSP